MRSEREAALLAEVERIRRAGRRLGLALAVFIGVVVEVVIVTDDWSFASQQPLLPRSVWSVAEALRLTSIATPSKVLAVAYETPSGIRVFSEPLSGVDQRTAGASPVAPWSEIATIVTGVGGFEYREELGLIRPCVHIRRMEFTVYERSSGSLGGVSEHEIRKAFYDWFVAREEYREWPSALSYATNIRDGVTSERRVRWHWVLHDAIVVPMLLWAMATIVSTPLRTFSRARRIRRGHCPHCDYDLLASFSVGCPECGWGRER